MGTMLFFPGVFLWLELVLRLAAGHSLRYLPISAAFALAAGLVCGAGLELFPGSGGGGSPVCWPACWG